MALLAILTIWGLSAIGPIYGQDPRSCDVSYIGSLGGGVIKSPNYPFNYTDGKHCRYTVFFNEENVHEDRVICFTFRRFHLDDGGCKGDYLAFTDESGEEVHYCGRGQLDKAPRVKRQAYYVQRSNVFSENFCWSATAHSYLVVFFSNSISNNTGFYADFVIDYNYKSDRGQEWHPRHPIIDNDRPTAGINTRGRTRTSANDNLPCTDEEFTCFDRQCVLSSSLCDGVDDCGDGSDEDYMHARCHDKQDITACDVESPGTFCQFHPINWLRDSRSPSGPRYDHTIGDFDYGAFFYNWHQNANMAVLTYNDVPIARDTDHCLGLWYFMSGHVGMGGLLVNITSSQQTDSSLVWFKVGNQGADWNKVEIQIPKEQFPLTQVAIYSSDEMLEEPSDVNIGVDDISLVPGRCAGEDLSCRFELGICSWENDPSASISWQKHKGSTPTEDTGPDSDTTGFGYYVYMEATDSTFGQTSRLTSHTISNVYAEVKCFTFWYYMYGATVNYLAVHMVDYVRGEETELWVRFNNHGPQWMEGEVTVYGAQVAGPYQLVIEAATGEDRFSDIAIDDLEFHKGYCSEITTTHNPHLTMPPCPPERPFLCGSGQCIIEEWVCDGRNDCPDHSDEDGCDYPINLSAGAIIGISFSAAAVVCAAILVTIYCIKKRKRRLSSSASSAAAVDGRPRTRSQLSSGMSDLSYSDFMWQQYLASRSEPVVEADSQLTLDPPPPYSLPDVTDIIQRPQLAGEAVQPPPYSPGLSGSQPRFTISFYPDDQSPPPQYSISIYPRSNSLQNTLDTDYENLDDTANITATRNDISRISFGPHSNTNVTVGAASTAERVTVDLNQTATTQVHPARVADFHPNLPPIQGRLARQNSWKVKAHSNISWKNRLRRSKTEKSLRGAPPELARAMARIRTQRTLNSPSAEPRDERANSIFNNTTNSNNISVRMNPGTSRLATGHGEIQQTGIRNAGRQNREGRHAPGPTGRERTRQRATEPKTESEV